MHIKNKRNIFLAQVNYRYGDNVFMPYSVATLQSYAQTDDEIRSNFEFQPLIFLREDPDQVARRMVNPAILGLSCYLWNWEYNKLLAQSVRAYHPECLIVLGGIHVPEHADGFFGGHSYVDVAVHGEGEVTFASILRETLSNKPNYAKISGISLRINGNQTLKTSPPSRLSDLSKLPSPYLTGVFNSIVGRPFLWNASQETNRGCPYPCTFCAWGPAFQQKLYQFDEERILEEFEWFGRHRIEFIFNCDANWGILDRDYDLTLKMVEIKARYGGYPKKFRMCTAKNSNDRVFDITKVLDGAGMNKGATLSFQSMDDQVLDNVKRRNIKIKDFKEFMRRYREAGIATYTELIMGLPGETYETFKKGIDKLIDAGQHSGLNNYVCLMLPNDEMNEPAYVQKYGIKSVRMPILLAHSTPGSDLVQEYQDVVVATNSMSEEDWQRMFIFSWAVQCFHCLRLTQDIAVLFWRQFGLSYSDFYERLIGFFAINSKTLIGQQLVITSKIVAEAIRGGRLDLVLSRFGDIYWPLEEAAFLNFVTDKEKFYREIGDFINTLVADLSLVVDSVLINDLTAYQSSLMIDPFDSELSVELQHDLHGYFSDLKNSRVNITQVRNKLVIKAEKDFASDLERYAREVVWYGRKGGKFHHHNIVVEMI